MAHLLRTAPAQARLEWSTNDTGFTVQSALSLGAGSLWQPFNNPGTVQGAVYSVAVGTTNAARFFRLRRP